MGASATHVGAYEAPTLPFWAASLATPFLFNNFVFAYSWKKKDNSIVDMTWSWSVFLPNVVAMALTGSWGSPRTLLSNALIAVWAARLSWHIAQRHSGVEDYRYKKWREDWQKQGKNVMYASWAFVFMLQAGFACVCSLSALYISINSARIHVPLGVLDVLGAGLFTTGFLFEAIGDHQLDQFKNNPANKGKLMTEGLWRYTRHPNYFGEAVCWWGVWLMACNYGTWGAMTFVSAATMTLLLRYVSGVAMLERKQKKKPEFHLYMAETSPFIPMPNKKLTEQEKEEILAAFDAAQEERNY